MDIDIQSAATAETVRGSSVRRRNTGCGDFYEWFYIKTATVSAELNGTVEGSLKNQASPGPIAF